MDKSIKKGYFQETPVQDQFLKGRVIFFVINYFSNNMMKGYR